MGKNSLINSFVLNLDVSTLTRPGVHFALCAFLVVDIFESDSHGWHDGELQAATKALDKIVASEVESFFCKLCLIVAHVVPNLRKRAESLELVYHLCWSHSHFGNLKIIELIK
jgi:hypothetical protein